MVRQEARITTAIENGEIRKIVMIDDAFDPPVLGDEDAGPMLEFLEGTENAATLKRTGVSPEEAEAAIQAINSSEYGEDALQSVVAKIYGKFVEKFDKRFDPTGRFSVLKGDNLRRIRPLVLLLAKCRRLTITRIGSEARGVDFARLKPDAVFVDYYLDSMLLAGTRPNKGRVKPARDAALAMLRRVLGGKRSGGPSVMLMSSHSVKDEADRFRREIKDEGKVFASRFHYISKDDLDVEDDGSITVSADAADALLDIAQCHKFASALEDALTHWKDGLDSAVSDVWEKITELELKDYAYLARFRLAEEGQPLSSYLEWFFGEVLIDAIARSVRWTEKSFAVLDEGAIKNKPGSQIEGAFDGATNRVAQLYYRARVDERPDRQGKDLRTGDLYIHKDQPDELLAVITPDCDLIYRRNKRNAERMTAVAGKFQAINAPDSSIADFFIKGGNPVNIVWDLKDIRTVEYRDIGADGHKLLGTLRPLYAYELQRRVLTDLSRVGLAVAPAMAMTAKSEVVVRGKPDRTPIRIVLSGSTEASCVVIPKRGPSDKPRVLFHRSFALELLNKLLALSEEDLDDDGRTAIGNLKQPKNQVQFVEKLCRDGQKEGEEAFGISTSLLPERTKQAGPWCQILVSHEEPKDQDERDHDQES